MEEMMMKKSRILAGLSAAAIAASMAAAIPAYAAESAFKGNAGVEFQTNTTWNFRDWYGTASDDGIGVFPDYHAGLAGKFAYGIFDNVSDTEINGSGDYTVAISAGGTVTEKVDEKYWYPIKGNTNVTRENSPWSMAGSYAPVYDTEAFADASAVTADDVTGWELSLKSDKFNMLGVTTDIPVYYDEDDNDVVHCYLDKSKEQEITVSDLVVKIGGTEYKADEVFLRDDLKYFGISVINTWGNSSIDASVLPPDEGMVEISFHVDVSGEEEEDSSSESETVPEDSSVPDSSSEPEQEPVEEPAEEPFYVEIPDEEINEVDIVGDEGWSEYAVPYEYVKDFPEGKAVEINIDYTKRKRYISSQEQVVKEGHDVKNANIALIIDTTGSMGDKIAAVRNNLADFVKSLKEKEIDVNFAIVDYHDNSIVFHEINGEKWSNDSEAVLAELAKVDDDWWSGSEYVLKAYDKLFEETPDWYTTSDTNFIFLLTDEDIDLKGDEAESYEELVNRLADLGICNTVVTSPDLNEIYQDLYEKTSGQVLDIYSEDYGKLMSEFASHVEDIVTHTVVYDGWKVTAIDGAGSVVVKGADSDDYSVDAGEGDKGTITLTISAEDAAKLFVEDPENAGMSLLKIKDFGLDISGITIEAVEDVPDEPSSKPDPVVVPAVTDNGASLIARQRIKKYEYRPMFDTTETSSASSSTANPAVPAGSTAVAATGSDDANAGTGAGFGLGITGLLLAAAAVVVVKKNR